MISLEQGDPRQPQRRTDPAWAAALALLVIGITARAFGPALGWGLTDADAWADVAWARHPLADQLLVKLTGGVGGDNANFWRPAVMVQLWAERALFGWAPAGWHAWDLLMHSVVSLCLAAFVHRLAVSRALPARAVTTLVTLLFAAHPLTEEVVPAVARSIDLLLGLGCFTAVAALVTTEARRRSRRPFFLPYLAFLAGSALALGAKESGVLLAPLAVGWILMFRDDLGWRARIAEAVRIVAPLALLILGYLAVRTEVMGGVGGYYDAAEVEPSSWIDATAQRAFIEPFVPSLSALLRPYRGWETWGPLLVVWAAVGYGAARSPHRRIAAYGALWFLAFTLLYAATGTYSRRVYYVPTAGGLLVIVPAMMYAWERRAPLGLALSVAWCATFIHGSPAFRRYPDWGQAALASDAWRAPDRWATVPDGVRVWLVDRPYRADLDPRRFRLWGGRALGLAHGAVSYSVEAWVDEVLPRKDLRVSMLSAWYLHVPVAEQKQELRLDGDTLVVRRTGGVRDPPIKDRAYTTRVDGDTLRITPTSRARNVYAVWTAAGPVMWVPGRPLAP